MNVRPLLALTLLASGCVALLVVAAHQPPPDGPVNGVDPLVVDLAQLKLTPEAVSASGLHGSLQTMLTQVEQATSLRQALAAKRTALTVAADKVTAFDTAVRASDGNGELLSQYQAAKALLQSLQGEMAVLDGQLLAVATANLPEAGVLKLSIFRQSSGRRVVPEFRVKQLTPDKWDAVESALIAERRAERLGQQLNADAATLLSSLRGDVEVIQAANNLAATLAQDQAAFAIAVAVETPEP